MKIFDALKIVTKISENKDENLENYLRSMNYVSNLYKFHFILKDIVNLDEIQYLPSFKDCYLSEKLGIATITEENELRLISIQSPLFLVDRELIDRITAKMDNMCNNISHEADILTFYLK